MYDILIFLHISELCRNGIQTRMESSRSDKDRWLRRCVKIVFHHHQPYLSSAHLLSRRYHGDGPHHHSRHNRPPSPQMICTIILMISTNIIMNCTIILMISTVIMAISTTISNMIPQSSDLDARPADRPGYQGQEPHLPQRRLLVQVVHVL